MTGSVPAVSGLTGDYDHEVHEYEARRHFRDGSVYHAVRRNSHLTECGRDADALPMGLVIWGDDTNADLPRCQVCQRRTEAYLRPPVHPHYNSSYRPRADKERPR